jgi:hypothetical protein
LSEFERCPCGRPLAENTAGGKSATCGENDHLFWPEGAEPLWRTPSEWEAIDGVRVVDPDGWRGPKGKDFTEPILRAEWDVRLNQSTVEERHG